MKKSITGALVTGAILGALVAGNAMAADMAVKTPYLKAPPPPAVSWTGCYLDAGGGYGMWNQDHSLTNTGFTPPTGVTTTDGGRGWLGRVGAGCDYQISSSFVLGVFGDYDFMSLKGSNTPSEVFGFGGGTGTTPITGNETETNAWYVGGRLGYLINPSFLTYVDGGYTQTRFTLGGEFSTLTGAPIAFGFPNYTDSGWFLGSGFETSLASMLPGLPAGLFLRTEYRYSSFKAANDLVVAAPAIPAAGSAENIKPQVQSVMTSLVWRFNWH